MMVPIKHDRVFMMDPASRFLDTENAGAQTDAMRKVLGEHPGPIYTCTLDKRVPGAVLYPLEEVVKDTGLCYFNNTVPYAIAFALYHKVKKLYLYGIDYSYKSNLVMAEAGRACVPEEEKLYGYHRLDDPLVLSIWEGSLTVAKKSEATPPEPTDEPVLYGRHDKVVLLKEAANV